MQHIIKHFMLIMIYAAAAVSFGGGTAVAATCSPAGAQGAAPAAWQTYCWLDFSTYSDTTARSALGQNFSFDLDDGSTLTFNLRATSSTASAADDRPAPSWSGAAVGNSSFLNIPGRPILYMVNSGALVNFIFSNITVIPPPGVASVSSYAFVAADAESTDNSEYLEFGTNGSTWQILDAVPPISGNQFPVLTGTGTATLRMAGGGQTGRMGGYIAGTNTPTNVTAEMRGQGLQGMMFAVRFASITLNKVITGSRIDADDQFTFQITSTSSGDVLASGTTSGTGNGPFPAAVISTASGIPISLTEVMASGSASAINQYRSQLTCANNSSGSPTVMPTNAETTNYSFGSLAFGDAVECVFNNTPFAHLSLEKQLGAAGRIFDSDEFRIRIREGSSTVAARTTTGTGAVVSNAPIAMTQLVDGNSYQVDELARGTTDLSRYTATLSCTNANSGSSTILPSSLGIDFTPAIGDVISCIITNTRDPANAVLEISKQSMVLSDPVNGTSNPKAIPGAVIRYTIEVTNRGDAPVDTSTIEIADVLPPYISYNASAPVTFSDGPVSSGLDPFDATTMVDFSDQPSGGAPYSYAPNIAGFDSNVTGVIVNPAGILDASTGSSSPSFTISFEVRLD
ncbi:MAG: CshA/CshB family fibrillar adhesin-related protein [Parasphingorhabdus sp.]|uniref:CshA/CshB family fibrillar adhesin-related protein n=1 Tax=Parasphingorhabdus sp. TaxID=2709688 RepID=UPI00329A0060